MEQKDLRSLNPHKKKKENERARPKEKWSRERLQGRSISRRIARNQEFVQAIPDRVGRELALILKLDEFGG